MSRRDWYRYSRGVPADLQDAYNTAVEQDLVVLAAEFATGTPGPGTEVFADVDLGALAWDWLARQPIKRARKAIPYDKATARGAVANALEEKLRQA